jgi:predicted metalloprotease with PDZ domain
VDFYDEGTLIWLEADVLIRQRSRGAKSLDDFCHSFHGGPGGVPALKTYTFEDVIAGLNSVQANDWAGFFNQRVKAVAPRAPLGGIENGGWKLTFNATQSELWRAFEGRRKNMDLSYSIGMVVKEDGTVQDVAMDGPAQKAGVAPAVKIIAIDNRQFTLTLLREAVGRSTTNLQPMEILVKDGEYYKVHRVEYHGGEKYPHLERDASKPDVLTKIIEPRTK